MESKRRSEYGKESEIGGNQSYIAGKDVCSGAGPEKGENSYSFGSPAVNVDLAIMKTIMAVLFP